MCLRLLHIPPQVDDYDAIHHALTEGPHDVIELPSKIFDKVDDDNDRAASTATRPTARTKISRPTTTMRSAWRWRGTRRLTFNIRKASDENDRASLVSN